MNPKQKAFAREYTKDHNATQAAIRAGYTKHTAGITGHKLLKNSNIQAEIQEKEQKVTDKFTMTHDEVLAELQRVAQIDLQDCVDVDEEGAVRIKPFESMPSGASRALESVEEDRVIDGVTGTVRSKVKIKRFDKVKALGILNDHYELAKGSGRPAPVILMTSDELKNTKTASGVVRAYQALLRSTFRSGK